MVLGALRLTFITPPAGATSRGEAQKIKDHLWSKFKISVAEIPNHSADQIVIGCALAGSDDADMKDRMEKIVRHLNEWGVVELVNEEMEVIIFDDIELERDFEKYNP